MPPPRAARSRPAKVESDSDGDTDRETTPKPISSGMRRRLSDYPQNGQDGEDTSNKRAPVPAVIVNDDAAEKRRRRKSARMTALPPDEEKQPAAGPSNISAGPTGNGPVRTPGRGLQRLESVAQVEPINVPRDVMSSNFEEWMKMATDNKINAANSWNFALIDYFHDMSLLRNPDDNTINFQRASCTVDACVKIWTSRVDSVGTETGRLLSNLAQERGLEEEAEGSDEEGGEGGESQTRARKKRGPANTLAKDPAQLKNKKPDLEFSVDPLFKKTCADFDEGGAQGLLMSHLNLGVSQGGGLRIVFDASDAPPRRTDEEEQDLEEPVDEIDITALRGEFFPDLDVLEDKAISHSLSQFTFGKDAFFDEKTFPAAAVGALDSDDEDFGAPPQMAGDGDLPMEMGPDGETFAPPPEDFFSGEQAIDDDFGGGVDDFAGREDEDEQGSVEATAGQYMAGSGGPGLLPFDPTRPTQQQYVMALTEGDDNMLNYFDQGFVKNWAGPEHWKLRKPIVRKDADGAAKPKREKKEAFKIDFTTPSEKTLKEITKDLFAPVTRGAAITLPGRSRKRKTKAQREKDETREKDLHLLPDDMHFSSRELVTLFLKPEFQLKMRGKALQEASADQEIDADYWAKAAERAAEADAEPDDSQMPFATQFFNDDDDDGPGFDGFDGGGLADGVIPPADDEQDLLAGSQGPKRKVKPEFVNYAKRAKRVDVRRLKENIWKGLDIIVPTPKAEEDMDEDHGKEEEGTNPNLARGFGDVVSGLRGMYPREKMEEISTSFCFICLLHLANERGLKLEVGPDGTLDGDDDMGMGTDKRVGELANLNVYRDAHAIPAA